MPVDAKQCSTCDKVLALEQFHKRGGSERGYRSKCKDCYKQVGDAYRASHREAHNAKAARWRYQNSREQVSASLRWRFGITLEDYESMLEKQGGVCAICGRVPGGRRLSVDHCHESGQIRGLLCVLCNSLLGQAGDSTSVLLAAVRYLEVQQ